MLQLLQPLWLYALTGISIPVIIHFWNQRPGKTLKVGSTSLITEDTKEYKRSLKLSDLLLLLVRCLLIAALALALSKPTWRHPFDAGKQKGWILISPQNINEIYAHFKPIIDSLQKAGLEFHYFDEGFQTEKLEDALAKQPGPVFSKPISYWGIAALLDQTIPGTVPVYVFTDNYLKHFSGSRPVLANHLNWFTYTPPDTAIQTKNLSGTDTASLRISVFTDKYANDARYVKAAIDAVQEFSKRNIKLSVVNNSKDIPSQPDWLFWLSDQPLANTCKAKNIFSYEPGKVKSTSSVVNIANWPMASPPGLYKSLTTNDSIKNSSGNIWTDGFGNPVLSFEKKDSASHYHFYTHFDPSWNELAWNDNFPAMIYHLLQKEKPGTGLPDAFDKRLIDTKQLLPAFSSISRQKGKPDKFTPVNLSGISWLLVLLLFLAERLASFQNSKLKANG